MQEIAFGIRQALALLTEYDWIVAVSAVTVAAVLVREMLDSAALAAFAIPLMLLGALTANYLFQVNFIMIVSDRDTNVVIASALGVLGSVSLLLIMLWITSLISEKRSKHKKLLELPPAPGKD